MSEDSTESDAARAVRLLERELETARKERDEFRDRWLKQVDINDKLKGMIASEALANLESMGRE